MRIPSKKETSWYLAGVVATITLVWQAWPTAQAITKNEPPWVNETDLKQQLQMLAQSLQDVNNATQNALKFSQTALCGQQANTLQRLLIQRDELRRRLQVDPRDSLVQQLLASTITQIEQLTQALNRPDCR